MNKGYNRENPGACISYHDLSKTPEHGIWRGILQRCYNPKRVKYAIYGARGIVVCDSWLEKNGQGFMNFLKDMGERPTKEHSIERIDNNVGYYPENCRWATKKEQARNRTTSRLIVYKKETKSLAEWCEIIKLPYSTVQKRLDKGWEIATAFEKPIKGRK